MSGSEDGTIRIWQTGHATPDEGEMSNSNGHSADIKVNEVAAKVGGLHIAKDGQVEEKAT